MKRLIISILFMSAFVASSFAADSGLANPRTMGFPPLRRRDALATVRGQFRGTL